MNIENKILAFLASFVCLHSAHAASFDNLIICNDWSGFKTECRINENILIDKTSTHSRFDIKYNFSCDDGSENSKVSPIEINIETENGQIYARYIEFNKNDFFSVEGFGPIKLRNTDPELLKNLILTPECRLSMSFEQLKSDRTVQEEQKFIANIESFLKDSEKEVQEEFKLLIQYRADVEATLQDQIAMACIVKQYEGDHYYDDIIAELRFKFSRLFSREYSPDLCSLEEKIKVMVNDCPQDSTTRLCVFKGAYFKSKGKIDKIRETISVYLQRENLVNFYDRLNSLDRKINDGFQLEAIN
jgi:hypothetical protein